MVGKQSLPGVGHYKDRHGKLRWRYRKNGFTVNLGTEYGSHDFLMRYSAALKGERLPAPEGVKRVSQAPLNPLPELDDGQHHLADLIAEWYKSPRYMNLSASSKQDYRWTAEYLREEYGGFPVETLNRAGVIRIMNKKADRPAAANKILQVIRALYDHAVNVLEWVEVNPAKEVKKLASKNPGGFHTWTEEEISKYQACHKEGTLADLSMALMLYTGAARSDAVRLGPANIVGDRLQYTRKKMETRGGGHVDIPLHPALARRLARLTPDTETFLQTRAGEERSARGFGVSMRRWCDAAGLPDCTAHGLRKAIARRLAEAGATPHEIMAVTGHTTLSEVERYTKAAGRAGLADRAIDRLTED